MHETWKMNYRIYKFNIIRNGYTLNLNGHINVCNNFITMTKKISSTVWATKRQQTYATTIHEKSQTLTHVKGRI